MSAPRRPENARPRTDTPVEIDPEAAPPSYEELEAIERHRIDWTSLLGGSVRDDDALGGSLVSFSRPTAGLSFLARVRWASQEVETRLQRVVERMEADGTWPSLIVSDGLTQPVDLPKRLVERGWFNVSSERIMTTRHPTEPPHLDPGLRIEAVVPRTAAECVALETEIFGLPPDGADESARLLADAVARGAARAFIVRQVHEAVASARLVPGPIVAGLHAVGVVKRYRRRGYGRLVTAVATRAGLATRHKLVWLSVDDNNTAAVTLYRDLGYEPSFSWSRWVAPAASRPVGGRSPTD
jgi:ribosomal protein S18 acetylase RimI-like enzyme